MATASWPSGDTSQAVPATCTLPIRIRGGAAGFSGPGMKRDKPEVVENQSAPVRSRSADRKSPTGSPSADE
jgi:hypothetical protein